MKLVRESIQFTKMKPLDAMGLGDVEKREKARVKRMLRPTAPLVAALKKIKIKAEVEEHFDIPGMYHIALTDMIAKDYIETLFLTFIPKECENMKWIKYHDYTSGFQLEDDDGEIFHSDTWEPVFDKIVILWELLKNSKDEDDDD